MKLGEWKLDKWGRPLKFTYRCRSCCNEISYMQLRKHLKEFHGIELVIANGTSRRYETEKYYEVFVNEPFVFGENSK